MFQPFLRFWRGVVRGIAALLSLNVSTLLEILDTPQPPIRGSGGRGDVSTLLEILVEKLTGRPYDPKSVSTLLEILVRLT